MEKCGFDASLVDQGEGKQEEADQGWLSSGTNLQVPLHHNVFSSFFRCLGSFTWGSWTTQGPGLPSSSGEKSWHRHHDLKSYSEDENTLSVVNCGRVEELDISHARLKDVARWKNAIAIEIWNICNVLHSLFLIWSNAIALKYLQSSAFPDWFWTCRELVGEAVSKVVRVKICSVQVFSYPDFLPFLSSSLIF